MKQSIPSTEHVVCPAEPSPQTRAQTTSPSRSLLRDLPQQNRDLIWMIRGLLPLTCAALLLWLGAVALPPQAQTAKPVLAVSPATQGAETRIDTGSTASTTRSLKSPASAPEALAASRPSATKKTAVVKKALGATASSVQKNKPVGTGISESVSPVVENQSAAANESNQNAYESLSDTSRLLGGN